MDSINVKNAWEYTAAQVTCGSLCRKPEHYIQVAAQFNILANPRYTPGQPNPGNTYCNIFVWDVTKAMSCEIPHWYKGKELNANALCDWLSASGEFFGWRKMADLNAAKAEAAKGKTTVPVWKNPNPSKSGHVAILLPSGGIAQAGRTNLWDAPMTAGFGNLQPLFYSHD